MSFSRVKYDQCTLSQNLNQNVTFFSYVLDPVKYKHCSQCMHVLGTSGGNNVSQVEGNLVDLESNLFGIDRPQYSKCASLQYIPTDDGKVQGKADYKKTCYPEISTKMKHLPSCQMFSLPGVPMPRQPDLFKCPYPAGKN
jgi:hypothetical protein